MSSGVEFDEDTFGQPARQVQMTRNAAPSKMVAWLMKKGIVKSPNAGQVVLIIVVILNAIVTFVVIKFFIL